MTEISPEIQGAIAVLACYLRAQSKDRVIISPNGEATFTSPNLQIGLYGKYLVAKADGSGLDPAADYFVLRIDPGGESASQARVAVYLYAHLIRNQSYQNEQLAQDLLNRLQKYEFGETNVYGKSTVE